MPVDEKLLKKFKNSIGDHNDDFLGDNNETYKQCLSQAIDDLITDDISEDRLKTELGESLIILIAESILNKTDIATNPTISLQRNKLSLLTKGDKYGQGE